MADLNFMLNELNTIAANPKDMLTKYLGEGKKVIGCFPIYTPGELVHAAGMIPMGLWGGQVAPSVAGQYAPIFTCSLMRSCLDLGMLDKYAGLSAAMMSMVCDTYRGMSGAWRVGVKNIPLISFIHPQNRADAASKEFLIAEYGAVKIKLEAIAGCEITDQSLNKTFKVYNAHNAVMREFAEVANDHLDVITPNVRHSVMKSSHFMEKAEHTAIVEKIIAALQELPVYQWAGKKVILSGITAEPSHFLDLFTENKIAVVGDDLAQESRQFRTDIPEGNDPMARLAQQWLDRKGCSVVHEISSTRGELIVELATENKADGIVVCLMKFCDVEEYDYPMIASKAEAAGIPTLCLDIDQSIQINEQSRTKVQSFAEMI
jgi:benzoyl-CoA reductase/2-hydroxyglutaryl-CoA dehydratase subunit BcrC/BadD/HgdB